MATYVIKTFGCQMNFSDSERIMTFMKENGFTPLDNSNDSKLKTEEIIKADLIIFNTCGVRASAENRVFGQINNILKLRKEKKFKPKIIVTGCSAHRDDFQKTLRGKVDLFTSIKDFPDALKKLNLLQEEEQEYKDYLSIQPNYKYQDMAVVPIMTGCNNFCTYCVVPYARGREWSRPLTEIVKEISRLNDKKYKEVTLLGQNVNSYNTNFQFSISNFQTIFNDEILNDLKKSSDDSSVVNINFPVLLNILARQFPKIVFKFLTSHPRDCSVELIQVIKKNKNIPKEIHLPIQAGSDKVLKDMNRPYTQKQYLSLIKKIRQEIPEIKITTDVIIGFPTETDVDFLETVKVFEEVGFTDAFLNKYSPRPGTKAFYLGDPIDWKVKKERERRLLDILKK
jgi:tRNA-2-methylthio-N6-dimethylallyladenosine synthase